MQQFMAAASAIFDGLNALNVTNKTDAAAVFFVGRSQASFFGQVTVKGYAHKYALMQLCLVV